MQFKELRERYSIKEKTVFSKRMSGIKVKIVQSGNEEFALYVDGEKLDDYSSQKEAEASAKVFIKEL